MRTIEGSKCDRKREYVEAGLALALENELQKMRERHAAIGTLTTGDVRDIVFEAPGILHGFIHEIHAVDRVQVAKDGGSEHPEAIRDRDEFRVGLYTVKNAYAEFTEPTLKAAVANCFNKLGVPIPQQLR